VRNSVHEKVIRQAAHGQCSSQSPSHREPRFEEGILVDTTTARHRAAAKRDDTINDNSSGTAAPLPSAIAADNPHAAGASAKASARSSYERRREA